MTDDEVRAALRRVRIGTPAEMFFRYAPLPIFVAAYLGPPYDSFRVWCVVALVVALVIGLALQQVRLRRDRAAIPDERRVLLRELLEKAVKQDREMYPVLAIVCAVLPVGMMALMVRDFLGDGGLHMLPVGLALTSLLLCIAAGMVYSHRVRLPEHRRTLEALQPPVGSAPPSA